MTDSAQKHDSTRTADNGQAVSLNTRELNPAEGRDRWADTLNLLYGEMDVAWPEIRQPFAADWSGRPFGDLHVSTIQAEKHTVVRSPAMIDSDGSQDYLLCLIAEGQVEISQNGRKAEVGHGSFAILDCATPFVFHSPGEFRQVVVRAPRELLTARLPEHTVRDATARAVSGKSGAGMLVGGVLFGIASMDTQLSPGSAASFSASTLDMLVTALAETPVAIGASATARNQDLLRVKHAIERDLHNPDRTLGEIAAEVGMSLRYIHKLFAATGTTPRGWLYQTRLDRARKYLLTTDLTVAEISEQVGFRDVSHFSRTFRARFGMSPGHYRSTRLRDG